MIEQVSDNHSSHFRYHPFEGWLRPKAVSFECVCVESELGCVAKSAQVLSELIREACYRRHIIEARFPDHIFD
jgi:hypothetical protein